MALSFRPMRLRVKASAPLRAGLAALALLAGVAAPGNADAQQSTFHLDRLEMPGAPDDGMVLFRPATQQQMIVYGQLALGYQLNPLRMTDITSNSQTLYYSAANAITSQFSMYASAGMEFFDHLTIGFTLPVAWYEAGNEQNSGPGNPISASGAITSYGTSGPAAGNIRLDARYVVWRNEDRSAAFGAQLSVFAPTGAGSSTNFGGDGSDVEAMPMITGEWTPVKKVPVAIVANTGVMFRPGNSINDPAGNHGTPNGLGIGNEWRWAVGAYLPLKNGKYRLGADIFGQTGLTGSGDQTAGNTIFTRQNTPIEWDVEARMKLHIAGSDHWYVGGGAGSLLAPGYGAPDLRVLALFGAYFTIEDTNPASPEARLRRHEEIREGMKDTDGDGIPDDLDACPTEPEDHKDPDPGDGCPAPADRDGDGIPDSMDKCPDQPEDKDGVDDADGCPEDDADQDGIPDVKDACPKEPGQPDPDPKKNGCPKFIKLEGSTVRVLQQVHFATGSATILPDSFPMLLEIVKLLQATPAIHKMKVEGHTDNRGAAAMNLDLSKRRAASVVSWLAQHGIDPGRLSSEGYGITRPIDTNDTDAGRQANRRVEFKIIDEEGVTSPSSTEAKPADKAMQ